MPIDWSDLIVALGLVLVLEGLLYAAFPNGLRSLVVRLLELPDGALRAAGLATASVGLVLVWLVRGA